MYRRKEKGSLTLEACISVTVFIFFMLFLYSLFVVFEARNELAHVVLATADSLALDTYEINKTENNGTLVDIISMLYNTYFRNDSGFTSGEVWNEIAEGDDSNKFAGTEGLEDGYVGWDESIYVDGSVEGSSRGKISTVLGEVIKERFVAYIADGDESKADELLKKRYHVHDGLNGISFAESHISSGKIYIVITYSLDLEYKGLLIGRSEENYVKFRQSACSKLWG